MHTNQLDTLLTGYTLDRSGHDPCRTYIDLSQVADCELELYRAYLAARSGIRTEPSIPYETILISCELEAALRARLAALGVYSPGRTIHLYDGLVQGHTDGETPDGDLLEIKTVALERNIPWDGQLPRRIHWQINAYLRYTGCRQAHIIYLARDTGRIHIITVRESQTTTRLIAARLARLAEAIRTETPPVCTCGHCPNRTTAPNVEPVGADPGERSSHVRPEPTQPSTFKPVTRPEVRR